MSPSEFSCRATCNYFGQPWPANLPKPTCRLLLEYAQEENPVTKAVLRDIIGNRLGINPDTSGGSCPGQCTAIVEEPCLG